MMGEEKYLATRGHFDNDGTPHFRFFTCRLNYMVSFNSDGPFLPNNQLDIYFGGDMTGDEIMEVVGVVHKMREEVSSICQR